jgi:hypothetical protein
MPGVTTHLPHLPSRASRRVPGRAASLRTYLPRPGARRLPGWARFAAIELGVWLGLYAAYLAVRMVAISGEAGAMANAREIVDVERYTGLLVETDVQGWLEPLHSLFSAYYMLMFGPLVAATLVGLALRRRAAYAELSRALLLAIAIASIVFVMFPAAPPRLVPELGIADTVGLAGSHDSGSFGGVKFNPYAAMPSMHVGWSLLVGITLFGVARRRWLKAAAAAHPALMTVTVVATGNHYLLDAVAGAAIALFSLALVRRHASRAQAQPSRRALPSARVQAVRRTTAAGRHGHVLRWPGVELQRRLVRADGRVRRPCNCTTRTSQPAAPRAGRRPAHRRLAAACA